VPGTLFVVATPLGNLHDLSPRALEVLRESAAVACEDTRRTRKLCTAFGVEAPLLSCHRFNERRRATAILRRLHSGESVALVSDGGTPGISDPGAHLVQAALEEGIPVSPIPGPSAAVALLSVSGFAADRFVFDGFLPSRAPARRRRLRELAREERPIVVLEAPHRLRASLADIAEVLGDRPLVLGRELTKLHETIDRGSAAELARRLGEPVRGEITLVLGPLESHARSASTADAEASRTIDVWRRTLTETEGDRREALKRASRELGLGRAELQRRLAELDEPD
jgi:16S rRNA (cytidine1402-2'-O)-methyltransferase